MLGGRESIRRGGKKISFLRGCRDMWCAFFNFSKNGLHWLQKLHIFQFLWQTHDNAYCDFSIGKISSSLNGK